MQSHSLACRNPKLTSLYLDREQDKDATVYIGNIDERATPATVYEIMLQMGPIHNIHMPRDRVTQSHQGFGFVEFRTPADAEYAANVINGVKLYGKSLRVNKASADKQKSADVGAELFIGNLDPAVDEKILYDTFSRFGPLLSMPKVARDDNGSSKGFGFVSFGDFESSDAAVANIHGQYILSKEVSVQYAFKKDGKGERHGDEAERKLASQAKKRNLVPDAQPIPPAFLSNPPPSQPPPQQQQQIPPQHQPLSAPVGFDHSPAGVHGPPGGMPMGMPPQGPPAGFNPPMRGPPAYNAAHGPPPGMAGLGRGSAPLPPAPTGLPARPPQGHPGGYPNPADFHPGHPGHPAHGAFRPPTGSPGPPPGFAGSSLPPPPPGFPVPPGSAGAPPPPGGFAPPPGFQPPQGFPRR
jgi:splicing factor 3B subunit 4